MAVCYHGAGFVGFTGAARAAEAALKVNVYDIDGGVISRIGTGKEPFPGVDAFLHPITNWRWHVNANFIQPSMECDDAADLHILALPTVKGTEPWMGLVESVTDDLLDRGKWVMIESTVTPQFADLAQKLAEQGHNLALAPRRDWFVNQTYHVQNTDRIVGIVGDTKFTRYVRRYVETITNAATVHYTDLRTAGVVKALENSLLDIPSVLAQNMALRMPEFDIVEAFRLAGTHWRIPTYYPNLCVGGYCVPLGTRYLAHSTPDIGILEAARSEDDWLLTDLYERFDSIIVYGASYRSEVKVHANGVMDRLSGIQLYLGDPKTDLAVVDPRYTPQELKGLGFHPYEGDWQKPEADLVLIPIWYDEWKEVDWTSAGKIIDQTGVTGYPSVGQAGWLA